MKNGKIFCGFSGVGASVLCRTLFLSIALSV